MQALIGAPAFRKRKNENLRGLNIPIKTQYGEGTAQYDLEWVGEGEFSSIHVDVN